MQNEKLFFRIAVASSLDQIIHFDHQGLYKAKPKEIILENIEELLCEDAFNAYREIQVKDSRIARIASLPLLSGFILIVWPIIYTAYHPGVRNMTESILLYTLQTSMILGGLALVIALIIMSLFMGKRDTSRMFMKGVGGFALRVVDYEEGKQENIIPPMQTKIETYLSPDERKKICDAIYTTVDKFQKG